MITTHGSSLSRCLTLSLLTLEWALTLTWPGSAPRHSKHVVVFLLRVISQDLDKCFTLNIHKLYSKGLCKVKKIQEIQKNLDRPTHPPSNFFFGNPSLTWTEHSNHNNQQLLAAIYTDRIHKISVLVYGGFPKKIPRETWTTSIVISDFWKKIFAKPLTWT